MALHDCNVKSSPVFLGDNFGGRGHSPLQLRKQNPNISGEYATPWGSWAGHTLRHCVQVAKISRHRLNLKGKATMMEKENHRNGGRQDAPKPVEGKMKISLKVHDREADTFLLSFFGGEGAGSTSGSVKLQLGKQGERSNKNSPKTQEAKWYPRFTGWVLHYVLHNQHHEQGIHILQTEQSKGPSV